MEKAGLRDFILSHSSAIPMDQDLLSVICDQFDKQIIQKGEFLLRQGRISNYYFLEKGCLRVFTYDPMGNEVTTYFYSGPRMVFDAASYFQRIPSAENIQAMSDCIVYGTSFEKLNTLFHSIAGFREFGRMIIVKEFAAYKQRTLSMISMPPEDRYLQLIQTNQDIFQFAHLSHIASYLGISERTLNRIRRNTLKSK
jgi:CRP-like cAMP-binding protein